jgi:hypothetical protein
MDHTDLQLVKAWLKLVALTAILALAADVTHTSRLGPALIVTIALAMVWKARLVLGTYLGLRTAPPALAAFTAGVVFIVVLVAASFALIGTSR